MFKKSLLIIIINIILISVVCFFSEYMSYCKLCERNQASFREFSFFHLFNDNSFFSELKAKANKQTYFPFKDFNIQSNNKKSIIVLGCSVAYGVNMSDSVNYTLNDFETVSFKLSNALNQTVYNRALPGYGLSEILYEIKNKLFTESIKKTPEYIFLFYNEDFVRRMVMRCTPNKRYATVFYKKSKDALVQKKFLPENLYFYNLCYQTYFNKRMKISFIENNLKCLLDLYIKSIYEELKAEYPNCKFLIIKVSSKYDFEDDILKDYNVIDLPELAKINLSNADDKYYTDDCFHPNELYWNTVLPIILSNFKKLKTEIN